MRIEVSRLLLVPMVLVLSPAISHGRTSDIHEQTFDAAGPRTRVLFTLPPRSQGFLRVQRK